MRLLRTSISVSYTHLDVYKRQLQCRVESNSQGPPHGRHYETTSGEHVVATDSGRIGPRRPLRDHRTHHHYGRIRPVSYTHLDVYKRQDRSCALEDKREKDRAMSTSLRGQLAYFAAATALATNPSTTLPLFSTSQNQCFT